MFLGGSGGGTVAADADGAVSADDDDSAFGLATTGLTSDSTIILGDGSLDVAAVGIGPVACKGGSSLPSLLVFLAMSLLLAKLEICESVDIIE